MSSDLRTRVIARINKELSKLTEKEKYFYDAKSRYYELMEELSREQIEEILDEDILESIENPNQWK